MCPGVGGFGVVGGGKRGEHSFAGSRRGMEGSGRMGRGPETEAERFLIVSGGIMLSRVRVELGCKLFDGDGDCHSCDGEEKRRGVWTSRSDEEAEGICGGDSGVLYISSTLHVVEEFMGVVGDADVEGDCTWRPMTSGRSGDDGEGRTLPGISVGGEGNARKMFPWDHRMESR